MASLAVLSAVCLLTILAPAATLARPAKEPIPLSGPVEAGGCLPCHTRIAEGLVPGLTFSHGSHLMVTCTACHAAEPHIGGGSARPPMDTCYACHGLRHGASGELASSKCRSCHSANYKLRPVSHTKDWKAKPHADASRLSANRCMMCHNAPKDCDVCHRKQNVKIDAIPNIFHPVLMSTPATPVLNVDPVGPVRLGQCVNCHPDIDRFMPGRVIFAHAEHIRRDYQCSTCHREFPHSPGSIARPKMETCYACHGLRHAASGLVAETACAKCHPKDFKLVPVDHTKKFVAGEHKTRATRDAGYCAMCHQLDFCVRCHRGRERVAGKVTAVVIPAAHRKAMWRPLHGKGYLDGNGLCGACHESADCTNCHKTPMPHPTTWLTNHNVKGEAARADCNVCHTDRRACQDCHHSGVKNTQLVRANCTRCHDQFKKKGTATKLKDKGFAEHAVHFDVAKKKGKPYVCSDCHVDFGSSASAQSLSAQQAHDLRLCYGCHGALDYKNVLIAPWPGAALCRRCHTDLNI
jgi:hypothetical protein